MTLTCVCETLARVCVCDTRPCVTLTQGVCVILAWGVCVCVTPGCVCVCNTCLGGGVCNTRPGVCARACVTLAWGCVHV